MQKKSSDQNTQQDGVLIKISDLNSEVSIKNWIKEKLGYSDPGISNDSIKVALEGIIKDPLFLKIDASRKNTYITKINELIEKLK